MISESAMRDLGGMMSVDLVTQLAARRGDIPLSPAKFGQALFPHTSQLNLDL